MGREFFNSPADKIASPAALSLSSIPTFTSKLNVSMNANQLFDEMHVLDVLSVTTLMGRFARQHCYKEAMHVFSRMLLLGIKPNDFLVSMYCVVLFSFWSD